MVERSWSIDYDNDDCNDDDDERDDVCNDNDDVEDDYDVYHDDDLDAYDDDSRTKTHQRLLVQFPLLVLYNSGHIWWMDR